jgi:hypothetical protein
MRMPSPLPVIVASIVASYAFTQGNLRSRLQVITAPTRNAGVYHVATGTWTRNASIGNLTGEVTIYNNSCAAVYFVRLDSVETYAHRSRIPSPSGETAVSLYYGTTNPDHRWDERPGCSVNYLVTGFEVAYCSSSTATIDWEYAFASSYTQCADADMVPQYTFLLTGLPGGTPTGAQNCWTIDVDISGTTPAMVLSADGDGTYVGPSTLEQFGFSLRQTNQAFATFTGPIIAGDFTWTGGPGTVSGLLTPCTGTDGTIWDNPINLGEEGTGMASNDFFRAAATPGPVSPPSGPGCYYFGGNPHADFWLKLYADPGCSPTNPMTTVGAACRASVAADARPSMPRCTRGWVGE